ncbi:MAG: TIGR03016 family PEP-CTERM system-associated outer membrane protein, partial [Methylococcaceae bacterium]|nr:TIGR03016 family PEP-CTERM system-associated outer membrane protein [Methylococcaceae bacterium]
MGLLITASAMVTGTDIMGNRKIPTNRLRHWSGSNGWCIPLVGFFYLSSGYAREWEIIPGVTASQIYSDNINHLSSAGAKAAFATELTPGIKINRQGPSSKFNLNYRMQTLIYEGIDLDPKIYNQLQMSSTTELLEKSVFVDSTSNIGQANVSALGNINLDNISRGANSTEYRTFRLSPYWRPHLGGYAEGELRVGYTSVSNSGGVVANASGNSALNLDSNIYQESLYLNNGSKFDSSGVGWRMAANNQDIQRSQNGGSQQRNLDMIFRGYHGEVSYGLIDEVSLFVQGGYYDNHYSSGAQEHNGYYVTPGLAWMPNRRFNIAGGYGVNSYFAHLRWEPSQRTGFQVTYRYSSVRGSTYNVGGYGGKGGGY